MKNSEFSKFVREMIEQEPNTFLFLIANKKYDELEDEVSEYVNSILEEH